jgi:hypothetical protein
MIAAMPDKDFEQPTEQESRSRWQSITMNLAFLLSKLQKLEIS